MIKRYHVETPDQLKELNGFAKQGSAENLVKMWNVALRKDGKAPWDKSIFAVFDTSRGRKAYIGRKLGEGMTVNVSLKYNPALKYCEDHLKLIAG